MKANSSNSIRRSALGVLHWVEENISTKAEGSTAVEWQSQDASRRPLSFAYPKQRLLESSEPDWCCQERVAWSGVCTVQKASVWMIRPGPMKSSDPQQRLAIVFKKLRRLSYPGSPRFLQYYLRHGQWWRELGSRGKSTHLDGRVAILGNFVPDCRNYYHFWADAIADIWFLRQLLPESQMPQRYLMAFCDLPWQRQILDMCGIRPDQVIPLFKYDRLSVETLIVPVRDKGSIASPPWQANAIRSMAGWKNSNSLANRRIYLSRADAPRRGVANESQVRGFLAAQGFEVLTLDGLSVREQQELFASAAVIFSPHGAALTNLVWCSPGTVVVDFIPENHLKRCFRELAWQSEVDYNPIVCQQVDSGKLGIDAHIEITSSQIDAALGLIKRRVVSFNKP